MTQYLMPTMSDAALAELVTDRIQRKIPFAMTRFGDGEIYLLNNNAPASLKKRICDLWGVEGEKGYESVRRESVDIMHNALKHTDVIGLLDPSNPICGKLRYDSKKWSIPRAYVESVRGNSDFQICDHQAPRGQLFGNAHNFKRILNGASLTIITPNAELAAAPLLNILEAPVTITLVKVNDRTDLVSNFDAITEDVVIYGTSLTGKDIGVEMKKRGKVAIDFGATLDAWAGIQSRGWFAKGGLQHHCVINNL